MATGPIETHLHRSFNWENAAPGAREGPRGRSASCGNVLSAQCVRLRSEINHVLVNLVKASAGTKDAGKRRLTARCPPLQLAEHNPRRTVLRELATRKRR